MHHLFDDALDHLAGAGRSRGALLGTVFLRSAQRLGHLAVVAVDGHSLQTELPAEQVQFLDFFDGGLFGHVDRLGDGTRQEWLGGTHHPHMALVVDDVVAHRAGEHRHVRGSQVRCAEDALLAVDVSDDLVDLLGVVAEATQRPRDGLVDDHHRAAADELLHLAQAEVGLDAGGVAVHHQADGARGRQHAGLAVAHAVLLTVAHGGLPRGLAGGDEVGRHTVGALDLVRRVAVHAQHVQHVALVLGEPGERPHPAGSAGAGGVAVTGEQRREGTGPGATLDRVVGQAQGHQQGAEVGVTDAELAELAAGVADGFGGVIGAADKDLLGREDDLDGVHVGLDVEGVVAH